MNRCVDKLRQSFSHTCTFKPKHSPYKTTIHVDGAAAQDTIPPDETEKLEKEKVKDIQQVTGVYLYYVSVRTVDDTILPALSAQFSATALSIATRHRHHGHVLQGRQHNLSLVLLLLRRHLQSRRPSRRFPPHRRSARVTAQMTWSVRRGVF